MIPDIYVIILVWFLGLWLLGGLLFVVYESLPTREDLKRRLLGPPERIPQRALTAAILLAVAIALSGAWIAATSDVDAGTSSLPYLRPILALTTSVWVWVLGLAWILRRILVHRDRRYAQQAANVTGYEPDSVRRLAYEAKDPDGATRVVATSEDTYAELRDRIRAAIATGEDDTRGLNPVGFNGPDDGEYLPDGGDPDSEESEYFGETVDEQHLWKEVNEDDDSDTDPDQGETTDGDLRDPWSERFKLLRLEIASTLDFERILWTLVLPAVASTALLLIAVRLWVKPWLYPPILAAGVLVGILNYVRVGWKTSRRLEALREDPDGVDWADAAILVKGVEVPETRVQLAWLAGRRYAHDDPEVFADELAQRAYELVQGVPISPSVLEKQARQLERLQPDLHGFRDAERERIMTRLLETVEGADLIPKAKLIEDCIEHDIRDRRIGPGKKGDGYDPELVRESYRDLVPAALVEQDIALEGGGGSVTAVRLRDDPIPPEYGEVRAQFSNQFSNYAEWEPLYELPDVSDKLQEEPTYVDSLGYQREAA